MHYTHNLTLHMKFGGIVAIAKTMPANERLVESSRGKWQNAV